MKAPRLLISDSQAISRIALGAFLQKQPEIDVVGIADATADALRDAFDDAATSPEIVLLYVREIALLELVHHLKALTPTVKIVILSGVCAERHLATFLQRGVDAIVHEQSHPRQLLRAILLVATQQSFLDPQLTDLARMQHSLNLLTRPLTKRQQEVLHELMAGASNATIAQHLGISEDTVKTHVRAIMTKLGVTSRFEAACFALQHGLADE